MSSLLDNYFKLVRGMIPAKKETAGAVGMDVGLGFCKFVELQPAGAEYELVNWAIEPVDQGDVAGTLKKVANQFDLHGKSIYVSVSGKGTLIRYINMPYMALADLKKSFAIEADKYFPFAQDQIYTDCYILNPKTSNRKMDVMAGAAKKEIVDQRIKLLDNAGLPPVYVGLNPAVLANAFYVLEKREEFVNETVALLDVGESVSSVTIMRNKLPAFTRDIFIGGKDFAKRAANILNISEAEVTVLFDNPGEKREEVQKAYESAVIHMAQEIRLSFDYFSTENNIEIKKLLMTGGGAMIVGGIEGFEKYLETPVEMWDPIGLLKLGDGVDPEGLKGKSHRLGVAAGLALYQYDNN